MTTIRPSGGDRDEHRHRRALFDVTHSRLKSDAHDDSGQSYRATFNRMFTDTQTSIVLAAYRYSTKGYYNLNDALYAVDQEKIVAATTPCGGKNGMTFTVNQNLPDGWGGFYLSGRISDYWNRSGTEKQYQVSYNNSFGRLSGRRARSASIRQTAPVIVATIVFHSTSATRCGLAITAPPT